MVQTDIRAKVKPYENTPSVCFRSSKEANVPQQGDYGRDEVSELMGIGVITTLRTL